MPLAAGSVIGQRSSNYQVCSGTCIVVFLNQSSHSQNFTGLRVHNPTPGVVPNCTFLEPQTNAISCGPPSLLFSSTKVTKVFIHRTSEAFMFTILLLELRQIVHFLRYKRMPLAADSTTIIVVFLIQGCQSSHSQNFTSTCLES